MKPVLTTNRQRQATGRRWTDQWVRHQRGQGNHLETTKTRCRTSDTSAIQEGRVTLLRRVVRMWKEDDRTAQVYCDYNTATPS